MKHIDKNMEPQSFKRWRKNNLGASWSDFRRTSEYSELKEQLKSEQYDLCCYCEVYLSAEKNTHIEHVRPKAKFAADVYNYQNIHACCQNPNSCGHKKGNEYFGGFVSPLDSDCEQRFIYTMQGKIIPKNEEDEDANKTISILGLNSKHLKDRRKSIIKVLEEAGDSYIASSLQNFKEWFNGFYTVINYLAVKNGVQ